ncbi:response regulator transcription factor [Microbacterium sp. YMB-B2]|uniref:Response regulator transcription factor n=1 Tax=Microbacterium tenebrionis TaxID=2830665 RepID=A0A9X1LRG7_9MICO|nr:response regulator transcription factor [Microbacterium tenebrionis]MCC2030323.1 response regulator transcription factor [Microbacterium tenebrionis]
MSASILLVDDHPIVRAGLRSVIEARGFTVVGEASTGEEAVALASALHPDVVLCDLRLGSGTDGVDTTAQLRRMPNPPAVVILTTFDHDAQIIRAIEAGAAGYLLKDVDNDTIVSAISDAAAGAMVLTPGGDSRIIAALRAPRVTLTDRERDVLMLVDEGAANKEIASRLFISESTVKTHVVHLLEKLGVASRAAAASEARRLGLL